MKTKTVANMEVLNGLKEIEREKWKAYNKTMTNAQATHKEQLKVANEWIDVIVELKRVEIVLARGKKAMTVPKPMVSRKTSDEIHAHIVADLEARLADAEKDFEKFRVFAERLHDSMVDGLVARLVKANHTPELYEVISWLYDENGECRECGEEEHLPSCPCPIGIFVTWAKARKKEAP